MTSEIEKLADAVRGLAAPSGNLRQALHQSQQVARDSGRRALGAGPAGRDVARAFDDASRHLLRSEAVLSEFGEKAAWFAGELAGRGEAGAGPNGARSSRQSTDRVAKHAAYASFGLAVGKACVESDTVISAWGELFDTILERHGLGGAPDQISNLIAWVRDSANAAGPLWLRDEASQLTHKAAVPLTRGKK